MDNTETTWLNTREAAAKLGVAARDLYRLIDTGELAAYKEGRDVRLRRSDVDAYRNAHPAP